MKRIIGIILCFSVLVIACNKKEQTETTQKYFPKRMYVNATEGLRVRNSPSSDGEKIGLLDHLTEVIVTKENNNTVNIGGVDGEWVYITSPIKGWVFNGFLDNYAQHIKRTATTNTEKDIKEKFIGNWIRSAKYCTFYSNGEYESSVLESSDYTTGYWELKDDKVIINITFRSTDVSEWNPNEKEVYKYSFIDDTMILTSVKENGLSEGIFVKFGEGRDIFGNYHFHSDYVWESYEKYDERFGR